MNLLIYYFTMISNSKITRTTKPAGFLKIIKKNIKKICKHSRHGDDSTKFERREKMKSSRVEFFDPPDVLLPNMEVAVPLMIDLQPSNSEWIEVPVEHQKSSRFIWKDHSKTYPPIHYTNYDELCDDVDSTLITHNYTQHIVYFKHKFSVTSFFGLDGDSFAVRHADNSFVMHKNMKGKWIPIGLMSLDIGGFLCIDDYPTGYRYINDYDYHTTQYLDPWGQTYFLEVKCQPTTVEFVYKNPRRGFKPNQTRVSTPTEFSSEVDVVSVIDHAGSCSFEAEMYKFVYEFMSKLETTGMTDGMLVIGRICNALYLIMNAPTPTYCFWLVIMIIDNFIAQYKCDTIDVKQIRKDIVDALSDILETKESNKKDDPVATYASTVEDFINEKFTVDAPGNIPYDYVVETVEDQSSGFSPLMKMQSLLTGPLLVHLDNLACFMVTIGFVNPTCIRVKPFDDYRIQCKARTSTVSSFMEKIIVSAEYLWTTGFNCFATRSFDPIFGSSDALTTIQNDHAHLKNNIDLVLNGTYEQVVGKTTWEFDQDLARLEKQVNLMKLNTENTPQLKSLLSLMSASISNLQQRVLSHKQSMGTRMEPFAIKLFGGSSVGKSVITEHAVRAILVANGISCEPKHIITIDHSDKYDSNFRGDATCYIADDLANAYATFEVNDSSNLVIRMVNSVQTMAIMPEAQDKGRVPIAPFLFIATTNRQNLNAVETSTTPSSVMRRFHIHATVRVKSQYAGANGMLDKTKVHLAPKFGGVMPDLQLIDVTVPDYAVRQLPHNPMITPPWFVSHWSQPTLTGLDLKQFLLYACMLSKRHKIAEDQRMTMRNVIQENPVCAICKCPSWVCSCISDQSGFLEPATLSLISHGVNFGCGFAYQSVKSVVNNTITKLFPTPLEYSELRVLHSVQLIQEYMGLNDCTNSLKWWDMVPSVLIHNNPWFDRLYSHIERDTAALRTLRQARMFGIFMTSSILLPQSCRTIKCGSHQCTIPRTLLAGLSTVFIGVFTTVVHKRNKQNVQMALEDRKISADDILDQACVKSEHTLYKVMRYAAMAAGIGAALVALRIALAKINDQSMLSPNSDEEFEERSSSPNMWFNKSTDKLPKGTSVPSDLCNVIAKNIMAMKFTPLKGKTMYCDCLILDSDHLLMNKHVWFYVEKDGILHSDITGTIQDVMEFEFIRGENLNSGDAYFKTFTKDDVILMGGSDLVIVKNAVNGPRKSLLPYFIRDQEYNDSQRAQPASYVHKMLDGKRRIFSATLQSSELEYNRANGLVRWKGYKAFTDHTWIEGDCGAIAVSQTLPPRILGLHAVGVKPPYGNIVGCTALCTYEMLEPILSRTHQVFPLEFIPETSCGVATDMAREVPQIHFINQCSYNNRYEVLGYKVNIASYATKVRPTSIVPMLIENGHGENMWKGPHMRFKTPWKPFMVFMDKAMDPMKDLPSYLLHAAIADYVCGFLLEIKTRNVNNILKHFHPLTNSEILNGREGVRFMEGMAMSTSCCFPFSGKKRNKLVLQTLDDDGKLIYILQPEKMFLWNDMSIHEDKLAAGIECFFPFVSQQKDEIVPKLRKGSPNEKVRVFQSSCLMLSFIMRKYFLPVVRLMGMYPLASECMVGLNPFGHEFTEVFEHLVTFGVSRIFAGDYSSWDQKVSSQLSEAAFDAIVMIASQCATMCENTYTQRDLTIMKTLKYAVTHAIIICHGAVIRFHGTNPSGQTITTHLNSVMNSLLIRVTAYESNPELVNKPFRRYVKVITYGDDINAGVSPDINLDFSVMAEYLAGKNMSFTTDKKEVGARVSFMNISDVTFLKRSFVYHPKIGSVLGALDITSMYKCLYNWLKKDATEIEVLTSNFQMFAQELFGHGEKHYNLMLPEINSLARKAGVFLPLLSEDYATRAEKWFVLYRPKETYADYCRMEDSRARMWTQIHTSPPEALYRFPWVGVPKELRPGIIKTFKSWFIANSETSDGFTGVESDEIDSLDTYDQSAVVQVEEANETIQEYNRQGINFPSTYGKKVDIEQWLSRPVLLQSIPWDPAGSVNVSFNPLDLFLKNRAVARKVANYLYISGTMHIKIITTGTISHWGRSIVALEPWPLSNARRTTTENSTIFPNPTLRQCVHLQHVMIDPAAELGGEMTVQILSPFDNKISIPDSADNNHHCIRLHARSITPLKVLNGGTDGIDIRIYMHMSNVVLTGSLMDRVVPIGDPVVIAPLPTISRPTIVDQSGEYPNGIISVPSTLAANTIDVLGEALGVKPYTTPVATGLRAVSDLSSLIGFSNPTIMEPPAFVARRTFNATSSINGNITMEKLSLDVKQGIHIDSESSGMIESDPTLISNIVARDHLNRVVPWGTGSNTGAALYKCAVTPHQQPSSVGGNTAMSPAMWVATPFDLWRGTMILRIEIVASAFHRGKLRVVYDPSDSLLNGFPPSSFDNEAFSQIIDITKTRSYEFCIGWNSNFPWLRVTTPTVHSTDQLGNFAPTPSITPSNTYNGVIAVIVEAPLTVGATAPVGGISDADVLFFSRWEPDFSLASPRTAIRNLEFVDQSAQLADTPSSVRADHESLCLNEVPVELDSQNHIHGSTVGERIYSVRQIIKRPTFHCMYTFQKPSFMSIYQLRMCDFPAYRGGALFTQPSGGLNGAKVLMTLLNWYSRPYLGYTGSIRWKYLVLFNNNNAPFLANVSRAGIGSNFRTDVTNGGDAGSWLVTRGLFHNVQSSWASGTTAIHSEHNKVIEADIPFIYPGRYKLCYGDKTSDFALFGQVGDETWHSLEVLTTAGAEGTYINSYVSAGDDFTYYGFRYIADVRDAGVIVHI